MDNQTKELKQEELKVQTVTEEVQETTTATNAFSSLESWGTLTGQTLEDRKQMFLEEALRKQEAINQRLIEKGFAEVSEAEVEETAQVTNLPVQEPAVRETAKQRSERARKERKARKLCPVGDADTIDINRSITDSNKEKLNSVKSAGATAERAAAVGADVRMIRVFCRGHKKNWRGQPATEGDRRALEEDRRWLNDYLSGDAQRRKPHLDRITNEILSIRFTPEMLTAENFVKNAPMLKEMADKLIYFENLMGENTEYFASLPQMERDMLEANKAISGVFAGQLTNVAGTKGIDVNSGEIYNHKRMPGIIQAQNLVGPMGDLYNEACQTFDSDNEKAIDKEIARKKDEVLQEYKRLEDSYREDNDPSMAVEVNFTQPAPLVIRDDVVKIREMIGANQTGYQQNKDLVDRLYTEFFKINDTMVDISATARAIQMGCEDYQQYYHDRGTSYKKKIANKFLDKQEEFSNRNTEIQERAGGIKNVLEHLLKGKELNDVGKEILREYNM